MNFLLIGMFKLVTESVSLILSVKSKVIRLRLKSQVALMGLSDMSTMMLKLLLWLVNLSLTSRRNLQLVCFMELGILSTQTNIPSLIYICTFIFIERRGLYLYQSLPSSTSVPRGSQSNKEIPQNTITIFSLPTKPILVHQLVLFIPNFSSP